MTIPFTGEMMQCALCDRCLGSDPGKASNWRLITYNDKSHYFCPDHFPPDISNELAFTQAYLNVLSLVLNEQSA